MLGHPGLGHVAYILETPGMESGYDAINVRRAWDSAAGRPLDDLPPEAFETRRPRAGSAPAETALAENANENKIDTRVAGTRGRRTDRPGRADR
jgi:hypothetical protein